jgi:hypothetical protein
VEGGNGWGSRAAEGAGDAGWTRRGRSGRLREALMLPIPSPFIRPLLCKRLLEGIVGPHRVRRHAELAWQPTRHRDDLAARHRSDCGRAPGPRTVLQCLHPLFLEATPKASHRSAGHSGSASHYRRRLPRRELKEDLGPPDLVVGALPRTSTAAKPTAGTVGKGKLVGTATRRGHRNLDGLSLITRRTSRRERRDSDRTSGTLH